MCQKLFVFNENGDRKRANMTNLFLIILFNTDLSSLRMDFKTLMARNEDILS